MFAAMSIARLRWLLLGLSAVVLVFHSLAYDFVTDDAYISFVYARNLAQHGELTFNLGSPVEGYTNFLWTVVLAGFMAVGVAPEISSRVLGTLCAVATLYVVFRITDRALGRRTVWANVPPMLLAMSSGFACWSSGGLETQLFTLLCAIAIDAVVAAETDARAMWRAAVALALAAMTRPEGLLVAAVLAAARLAANAFARRWFTRSDLIAIAVFLVVWEPWFIWRWRTYGYPFPNTYYVKAAGPWTDPAMARQLWENGAYYVWLWLAQTGLVFALPLAAVGLIAAKPRTPRFVVTSACGGLSIAYLGYAVTVGGDFMGLHRFIMPVFICAALAVVLGMQWLICRLPTRWSTNTAMVAGTALCAAFGNTQLDLTLESTKSCANRHCPNDRGIDSPAFLAIYTADRAALGRALAGCIKPSDFSIVGGAGAQPYYAALRAVDAFGLVSERIAHESPRSNPRAGHTKWGSDALLASYDPTFVFSCYQIHRTPQAPPLPCDVEGWKRRGYEAVTVRVPELREKGQYYTFLAKTSRAFQCPIRVR